MENFYVNSPEWVAAYESARRHAKNGDPIYGFWEPGDHMGWLSNMWLVDIHHLNRCFRSIEHAYVASKDPDNDSFIDLIADTLSTYKAKRLGRQIKAVSGWDEGYKLTVMEKLLLQKFMREDLAILLAATGDVEIIEANSHMDLYWGVDSMTGDGSNHLGKLLMKNRAVVRDILKTEAGKIPEFFMAPGDSICETCSDDYLGHPKAKNGDLVLTRLCDGKWCKL